MIIHPPPPANILHRVSFVLLTSTPRTIQDHRPASRRYMPPQPTPSRSWLEAPLPGRPSQVIMHHVSHLRWGGGVFRASLRSEKDWKNIDIYRGFIEKLSLFLGRPRFRLYKEIVIHLVYCGDVILIFGLNFNCMSLTIKPYDNYTPSQSRVFHEVSAQPHPRNLYVLSCDIYIRIRYYRE